MLKPPFRQLIVAVLLLSAGPWLAPSIAAAQPPPQQLKADQRKAKAIAKEGDALLKAKKFSEGRAKYVEALRFGDNAKYTHSIIGIDQRIDRLIKKDLEAAERLFAAGKYTEALSRLDATLPLRRADPAVLYNRAVIAHKLGQKAEAVSQLEAALGAGPSEKERMRLLQLKTQWETGEGLQPPQSVQHEQAVKDVNEMMASGEDAPEVCTRLKAIADGVTRTPSLVFNLAKCAEDEDRLEDAARLVDEYLKLAPDTRDHHNARSALDDAKDLEQRAGAQVMALYGEADRAARQGRYRRAIDAMLKAVSAAPQVPESRLKLARLYQACDKAAEARAQDDEYLTLEQHEPLAAAARDERDALEQRSRRYEALLTTARTRLLAWTYRYIVESRPMGVAAAQDELASIAQELHQAVVMMPLASDVNRMLGQIYLYDGNYAAARKAFAIVAESDAPIWFYAIAETDQWGKPVISKVELSGREMRVIGVTRMEKKSSVPLLEAAADSQRMGGFLTAFESGGAMTTPYLKTKSISIVETDDDFVRVKWTENAASGAGTSDREVKLTPVRFASAAPPKGPMARRFANSYTKLFRDFSDQRVELGSERMTGGEKFGMAMSMAMAAYAGGVMSLASGASGVASVMAAAMRSATWATTTLQNAMDAQARMFQESQFKIMPIEDPKPVFRKDLFR